ncbi:MAG TPA: ABC transporter substrate-binding protein, partial [Virgibacillus sp.]|nr:ABC transporter substrate-binding protein [Virgibacillus sp.]
EMSNEQAEKVEPYLIDEVWPPFSFTEEEMKKLERVGSDIDKFVSDMRDKFIVGSESLDDWDKYVKEIEKMGLEDYMEVQKAAYERYKSN